MEPNALVRWPNETIPLSDGFGRPAYDELIQAQFVSGVLATIQDVNMPLYKNAMIDNLREIMDLSSTIGWLVAKAAFTSVMTRIEQGKISWDDPDGLWKARMDGKSHAFMGQNRGSPVVMENTTQIVHQERPGNRKHTRSYGALKEFTCRNYNANCCKEQGDHKDPTLPHKYIHACHTCYGNPSTPLKDQRHKARYCRFPQQ